jgi:hypothetical protein
MPERQVCDGVCAPHAHLSFGFSSCKGLSLSSYIYQRTLLPKLGFLPTSEGNAKGSAEAASIRPDWQGISTLSLLTKQAWNAALARFLHRFKHALHFAELLHEPVHVLNLSSRTCSNPAPAAAV